MDQEDKAAADEKLLKRKISAPNSPKEQPKKQDSEHPKKSARNIFSKSIGSDSKRSHSSAAPSRPTSSKEQFYEKTK